MNAQRGAVVGLDLSQESARIGLYDFSGKLMKKHRGFAIKGRRNEAEKLVGEVKPLVRDELKERMGVIPLEAMSAGNIIDNDLVRGAAGSAGQIAFTMIDRGSLRSRCASKGCLDERASVQSIQELAIDALGRGEKSSIPDMTGGEIDKVEPPHVCRAALNGERLAREILGGVVDLLSIGIINLVLAVNPQLTVLEGTVVMAGAARKIP